MQYDIRGLPLTTDEPRAASTFDEVMVHYFEYRLATGKRLKAVLEADPAFVMGHCMKGYLFMLFGSVAFYDRIRDSLGQARSGVGRATRREGLHVEALGVWLEGDLIRACSLWDEILFEHPHDLLALRLHHFNTFWMGRNYTLRSTVAGVLDAWDESVPGYGHVLGMLSFALEECGEYAAAEAHGRRAVEANPDDLWAVHAVAHVLEMQGRLDEGIAWLDYPADQWEDRNPFRGHLWWHAGLYQLEKGEYERVLALYDRSIATEKTDFYLDIQNMASLLVRLELQGIEVGERWRELAEHAATRTDDHVLAFTDVHCAMALAATGKSEAAGALIESLNEFGRKPHDFAAETMTPVTVPLCEAIFALQAGEPDRACEKLLAIRHDLAPIGGSHAQRDVFHQMLVESALASGRLNLARALLSERITLRPHSHGNWRKYLQVLDELGDAKALSEARGRAGGHGFADLAA